jgi:hypothetical protein
LDIIQFYEYCKIGLGQAGTQTAALAFGGYTAPGVVSVATESYNGSSWTSVNSMNTARYVAVAAGIKQQL